MLRRQRFVVSSSCDFSFLSRLISAEFSATTATSPKSHHRASLFKVATSQKIVVDKNTSNNSNYSVPKNFARSQREIEDPEDDESTQSDLDQIFNFDGNNSNNSSNNKVPINEQANNKNKVKTNDFDFITGEKLMNSSQQKEEFEVDTELLDEILHDEQENHDDDSFQQMKSSPNPVIKPVAAVVAARPRVFDARRHSQYFDDLLSSPADEPKQSTKNLGSKSVNSKKSVSSTHEAGPTTCKNSSSSSKKKVKLRAIENAELFSGKNAFFENPLESSRLLAQVVDQKRRALFQSQELKNDDSEKPASFQLPQPKDATVSCVLDVLNEEISKRKQSTNTQQDKEQSQQIAPSSSSQPLHYLRVQDLKRAIKERKIFSADGGPLPSNTSILRFLKQHTDKFFDLTGNGLYVAPFGTFSLADKIQPDYNPSFESSTININEDGGTRKKKTDKNKNGEDDDEFSNLNLDDDENNNKGIHSEAAEEWDIELDLETDEQAETNRIVQESFELEHLEELEEQGKLDKMLKTNSLSAFFSDGSGEKAEVIGADGKLHKKKSGSSSSSSSKASEKRKELSRKQAANIFKLFAAELNSIPSAPEINPAALTSALSASSSKYSATNATLISISDILKQQEQQRQELQLQQQQDPTSSSNPSSLSSSVLAGGSGVITRMAVPPLPSSASLSKLITPPPLRANTMSGGAGGTRFATPPALAGISSGWGSASHLHNQNINTSAQDSIGSLVGATHTLSDMLTFFVEVVPTFFVPVMLLRFSDDLRRATGNRDVGKVIRQYHMFFDFKQATSNDSGSSSSSLSSSSSQNNNHSNSLKNLLVKIKESLLHPGIGNANKLYAWADPNKNNPKPNDNIEMATAENKCDKNNGEGVADDARKNTTPSTVISPEILAALKNQQNKNMDSSSSFLSSSHLTADTPRIAPIKLATDQVDQDCQKIMSALNVLVVKDGNVVLSSSSSSSSTTSPCCYKYSASCADIVKVLTENEKEKNREEQEKSGVDEATTNSSSSLPDHLKCPKKLFKWIVVSKPRIFSVFFKRRGKGTTTLTSQDENSNQPQDPILKMLEYFEITLRPLNVAPGAVADLDLEKMTSSVSFEEEFNSFLESIVMMEELKSQVQEQGEMTESESKATKKLMLDLFNENLNNSASNSCTPEKRFLTADAFSEIFSKLRAGMWFDVEGSLKKKILPTSPKGGGKLLHFSTLNSSNSSLLVPNSKLFALLNLVSGINNNNNNGNIPIQWLKFFGKSVWIEELPTTKRIRKFTGTADLDDLEHFALSVLHAEIKEMVMLEENKSKKKMDFKLRAEILPRLPDCCSNLFSHDLGATERILKGHPNKFVVSSTKDVVDDDDLTVGYASLFRK